MTVTGDSWMITRLDAALANFKLQFGRSELLSFPKKLQSLQALKPYILMFQNEREKRCIKKKYKRVWYMKGQRYFCTLENFQKLIIFENYRFRNQNEMES